MGTITNETNKTPTLENVHPTTFCNLAAIVCGALAWKPELKNRNEGFLKAHWSGYNEAILLQILALGAPEYSLPKSSYEDWCSTYDWKTIYGKCDTNGSKSLS